MTQVCSRCAEGVWLSGDIGASPDPETFNWFFDVELVNGTNEWLDMSPTFNMTYQIWVDGTLVDEGYDEQAPWEND